MHRAISPWLALTILTGPASASAVPVTDATVVETRAHDPGAFTQGLLLHDGTLYESTGRYGQSTLRAVDPNTGSRKRFSFATPTLSNLLRNIAPRLDQITQADFCSRMVYLTRRMT